MTCAHGEKYRWHKIWKLKRQPKCQDPAWKGKRKAGMSIWARSLWLTTQIRRRQKATSKWARRTKQTGNRASNKESWTPFSWLQTPDRCIYGHCPPSKIISTILTYQGRQTKPYPMLSGLRKRRKTTKMVK